MRRNRFAGMPVRSRVFFGLPLLELRLLDTAMPVLMPGRGRIVLRRYAIRRIMRRQGSVGSFRFDIGVSRRRGKMIALDIEHDTQLFAEVAHLRLVRHRQLHHQLALMLGGLDIFQIGRPVHAQGRKIHPRIPVEGQRHLVAASRHGIENGLVPVEHQPRHRIGMDRANVKHRIGRRGHIDTGLGSRFLGGFRFLLRLFRGGQTRKHVLRQVRCRARPLRRNEIDIKGMLGNARIDPEIGGQRQAQRLAGGVLAGLRHIARHFPGEGFETDADGPLEREHQHARHRLLRIGRNVTLKGEDHPAIAVFFLERKARRIGGPGGTRDERQRNDQRGRHRSVPPGAVQPVPEMPDADHALPTRFRRPACPGLACP